MKTRAFDQRSGQTGFSLIEIMVGMVIGVLAIIVMMQVFAASEERKRTANAGSDAQNSAVIALDGMQRHIGQSGYGFALTRLLGCNLQLPFGAPITLAPVVINPPVAVIPAGDANTDTLLISYGLSNDQPEGYNILTQSGTTYTIIGTSMLRVGPPADRAIAAPSACGATTLVLGTVTAVNASVIQLSTSEPGTGLFNLGATPRFLAYAVRNGNLMVCDYMAANCGDAAAASLANPAIWRLVAENIASLRAQYGRDTSGTMDGTVDTYDQTTPINACLWARTPAIRLALVARSAQFEKNDPVTNQPVTLAMPGWLGTEVSNTPPTNLTPVPIGAPTNPDGTPDAFWQNYRYRVFQTVVPIRNVAWMGVVPGC